MLAFLDGGGPFHPLLLSYCHSIYAHKETIAGLRGHTCLHGQVNMYFLWMLVEILLSTKILSKILFLPGILVQRYRLSIHSPDFFLIPTSSSILSLYSFIMFLAFIISTSYYFVFMNTSTHFMNSFNVDGQESTFVILPLRSFGAKHSK